MKFTHINDIMVDGNLEGDVSNGLVTIGLSIGKEFHKYNRVVSIVSKPTENPFVQKFGCHK